MRSHKEGRSTLAGGGAALSDVVERRRVVGAAPLPHTLQLTSGKVSQGFTFTGKKNRKFCTAAPGTD